MKGVNNPIVFYSSKKSDYVFGTIYLVLAICLSPIALGITKSMIGGLFTKPFSLFDSLMTIFIEFLFFFPLYLFISNAYTNFFKRIEILTLEGGCISYTELANTGRYCKREYIMYSEIDKFYIKKTFLRETMICVNKKDGGCIRMGYINNFLSKEDKFKLVSVVNGIISRN